MQELGSGRRRAHVVALVALLATAVAPASAIAQSNPGVVPARAKTLGKTYGEWGDLWWNWAVRSPLATNPQLDPTGEFGGLGQEGRVWFLAGVLGGGSAERTLTVPAGTFLFVPLVNTFLADEGTEQEERAADRAFIDGVGVLEAVLDGRPLRDLGRYRAASPEGGFVLVVPPESLFTDLGAQAGRYEPAVSDGYYLMLEPLPVGEHELRFRAVVGDPGQPDFEVEVIYHLTVAPRKRGR